MMVMLQDIVRRHIDAAFNRFFYLAIIQSDGYIGQMRSKLICNLMNEISCGNDERGLKSAKPNKMSRNNGLACSRRQNNAREC